MERPKVIDKLPNIYSYQLTPKEKDDLILYINHLEGKNKVLTFAVEELKERLQKEREFTKWLFKHFQVKSEISLLYQTFTESELRQEFEKQNKQI